MEAVYGRLLQVVPRSKLRGEFLESAHLSTSMSISNSLVHVGTGARPVLEWDESLKYSLSLATKDSSEFSN